MCWSAQLCVYVQVICQFTMLQVCRAHTLASELLKTYAGTIIHRQDVEQVSTILFCHLLISITFTVALQQAAVGA